MRRVGARGTNKWEQISWDEAIDEICTKWKKFQKQFGDASIAFTDCAGNSAVDSRQYYKRVFNLMGAAHINNSFDNAMLTAIPDTVGWGPWTLGDDERNMLSSKYIFSWGGNFTEAGNVHYSFIQGAVDRGAKLIVIDPNYTIGASKADIYVPIRPGTDAVLAMAMLNIAVNEGKIDKDTLMYGTVAPFLVKESDGRFLRLSDLGKAEAESAEDAIVVRAADGTIGIPGDIKKPVIKGSFKIHEHDVTTAYDLLLKRIAEWTPERASEICDIPLVTLYELARMYAEGPTTLAPGYGPDHYVNGHCFYYAVTALALVTGQIGKPGAGLNGHGVSEYDNKYLSYDHIVNPPGSKEAPEFFATKVPEAIKNGKYGDQEINIKSLFIYNQNLIANQTNRKAWLEAFDKLDLIVVADVVMNDTTMFADIILPVAHYFELDTYDVSYTGVAVYNAKAVEPPGQAIGDFEIATLLGRGMGFKDSFTMTRDDFYTEALDNDDAKEVGLSWKSLKDAGYIYTITDETPIYLHGGNFTYTTTTGRGQFYREDPVPNTNYGQKFDRKREALPYWEPPTEAWLEKTGEFEKNPLSDKYPLIFTSERPKFRVHTQYAHNKWLLELQPEPTVTFNPKDANKRGIKSGDTVKIFNDRGYVVIKAMLNPANRPGVVVIDHGWQADEFIEGHYSDLSANASHNFIVNNAFFDCLVEAVKL
jgi:molybdopterin-containing oxidoreductase family molybdopterin binding subunit